MSFSNSLSSNAPHHLERIAKSFLEKRQRGDTATCDLKIKLKNGSYDLVHSNVVAVNSMYLNALVENQRPPYPPIDMSDFETASVKRTIDWMYSGVYNFPKTELAQDLAVVSFLQVNLLQNRFEQEIKAMQKQPIKALNIATRGTFTPAKKDQAFRPWLTMMHISDETMNALVVNLSQMVDTLTRDQVDQLEVGSIIACMGTALPLESKIPLINLAIVWILDKQVDRDVIISIIESIIISDVTYTTTYWIRYYMKMYLENPQAAGKGLLRLHKDGTMSIYIDPREEKKQPIYRNKMLNQQMAQWKADYDKRATDEMRKGNVGSFGRSSSSTTQFRRETSDGFPKFFTKSEVENLNDMEDGFVSGPKDHVPKPPIRHIPGFSTMPCTASYAGFDPARLEANKARAAAEKARRGVYTASEREENRAMPDPFVRNPAPPAPAPRGNRRFDYDCTRRQEDWWARKCASRSSNSRSSNSSHSNQSLRSNRSNSGTNQFQGVQSRGHGGQGQAGSSSQAQGPVLLCPARNSGFGGSNSSFSGFPHRSQSPANLNRTIQPLVSDTSIRSSSSNTSLSRNQQTQGIRKTASEIDEINQLPSIAARSSSSSQGKKAYPKSDYLYPK